MRKRPWRVERGDDSISGDPKYEADLYCYKEDQIELVERKGNK